MFLKRLLYARYKLNKIKHFNRQLRLSYEFTFTNADDYYTAEVNYSKSLSGGMMYKILFNGEYVHLSKTFRSLEKKLEQLISKYSLKFTDVKGI